MEFEGLISGDYEAFCWDVTKETFIRIKNREPDEFDNSNFNEGYYKIYPNDLFYGIDNHKMYKFEIKITK